MAPTMHDRDATGDESRDMQADDDRAPQPRPGRRRHRGRGASTAGRRAVPMVVAAVVLAACSGGGDATEPAVKERAEQPSDSGRDRTDATGGDDDASSATTDPDGADRTAGGDAGAASLVPGRDPIRLALPYIPVITLPDLAPLGATGQIVAADLKLDAAPIAGLSLTTAFCVASGQLQYQTESGSFLEVGVDGSGAFQQGSPGESGFALVQVNPDGSGSYQRGTPGEATFLSIDVNPDSSGDYQLGVPGDDQFVSIQANADGSGTYQLGVPGGRNFETITLAGSSGTYQRGVPGDEAFVDLQVDGDGSGSYQLGVPGDDGFVLISVDPTGEATYQNAVPGADGFWTLDVAADGSGSFQRGVAGDADFVTIEVEASGAGVYTDERSKERRFRTEEGIMDPRLLVLSPQPVFAVADRFPLLAKLAPLQPSCATVIRIDDRVLFDFDSAELRPEADAVLDQLAATLAGRAGGGIEVQGHTDALGDDAYNLELSQRRADAFTAALQQRGVTASITSRGLGEAHPVAPNTNEDGSDNPAGRQLNRRIEIVIRG